MRTETSCIEFWHSVAEKLRGFAELDDSAVVFGARTGGGGHRYRTLPFIGDLGCGATFGIELNGPCPGRMWDDWSEAFSPRQSFLAFHRDWVDRVGPGLERYQLLKTLLDGELRVVNPRGITVEDIARQLQCEYVVTVGTDKNSVPKGERWVKFEDTPARIKLDDQGAVSEIDIFNRCSIT